MTTYITFPVLSLITLMAVGAAAAATDALPDPGAACARNMREVEGFVSATDLVVPAAKIDRALALLEELTPKVRTKTEADLVSQHLERRFVRPDCPGARLRLRKMLADTIAAHGPAEAKIKSALKANLMIPAEPTLMNAMTAIVAVEYALKRGVWAKDEKLDERIAKIHAGAKAFSREFAAKFGKTLEAYERDVKDGSAETRTRLEKAPYYENLKNALERETLNSARYASDLRALVEKVK